MSAGTSADWVIRDDRALSAYAKLAFLMLWSRRPDIRPSMRTLARDMSTSVATAKRAVRELEAAGLLRRTARLTEQGDNDANQFELVLPEGGVCETPPGGPQDRRGGVSQTPKDSNLKTASRSGSTELSLVASRRAQPAVSQREFTDEDKIAIIQRAAILKGWSLSELDDEDILNVWASFVDNRKTVKPIRDHVSFFYSAKTGKGVFSTFEYWDGVLSNTPERDIA